MEQKTKDSISALFIGLIGIAVVAVLISFVEKIDFVSFFGKDNEKTKIEEIEKKIEEIQKTLSPYEKKDNLSKARIITNFQNSSKDNKPTVSFEKNLIVSGIFSEGYLYIKSSVNNRALNSTEDMYVLIGGITNDGYQDFGGHLITKKSLETPKSDQVTELLFNLNDIKYKERYFHTDIAVTSADWLKLFNEARGHNIISFVSTMSNGKIEELSFYYKCAGETECSISVE